MTGCPIAYAHPCNSCHQYGNCAPSQAVQKLNQLETVVAELKQMLNQLEKSSRVNNDPKN
jgi:hypothetical protein